MSTEPMQVRDATALYAAQAEGKDVPPGYKRTEVGVIPEDWEVKHLDDLGYFLKGSGVTREQALSGDLPCVRYGEIYTVHHDFIRRFYSWISPEIALKATLLKAGDILFAGSGETKEEIGKCVAFIGNVEAYAGGDIVILRTRREADLLFLGYALNSHYVTLQKSSKGQGDTVVHISASALATVTVALPPVSEQRAIATALSDVDALITALDKLIAKKRAIKTAAMQQLLTGKTRLPGFSGEWEVKQLGDVCSITTGRKDVNEGNPRGQYPFFTCSKNHTYSDSYSFNTEAILVAGNGDVGNLHYCSGKFEAYQRTYVLYDFSINVKYFWYQLDQFLLSSLGVGTIGTSIPYIKMENLRGFIFSTPQDPKEQTAIAQVLSDMDAEIAALEKRRAKTRAIKQGMMQELLTGRTRLV